MGFDVKINLACELTDWPLQTLAKRAGVNGSSLQTAVTRGRPMKFEATAKLAKALFVDVTWLMDDSKGLADLEVKPWWLAQGAARPVAMKGAAAKLDPQSRGEDQKRKRDRTA